MPLSTDFKNNLLKYFCIMAFALFSHHNIRPKFVGCREFKINFSVLTRNPFNIFKFNTVF